MPKRQVETKKKKDEARNKKEEDDELASVVKRALEQKYEMMVLRMNACLKGTERKGTKGTKDGEEEMEQRTLAHSGVRASGKAVFWRNGSGPAPSATHRAVGREPTERLNTHTAHLFHANAGTLVDSATDIPFRALSLRKDPGPAVPSVRFLDVPSTIEMGAVDWASWYVRRFRMSSKGLRKEIWPCCCHQDRPLENRSAQVKSPFVFVQHSRNERRDWRKEGVTGSLKRS